MQYSPAGAIGITAFRPQTAALAVGAVLAAVGTAQAFEINTGNPDLAVRWDNTVRYNLGVRAQSQDHAILGNPNYDDGDRNFSNGSIVTNRFDVLSEFDFVHQRKYGFRTSYAAWWDAAYNSLDNTNTATANTLVNGLPVAGTLSPYTERYSRGPSGEWLDSFVFTNFDLGEMPVNVKAGRHTVFWGDSLLLSGAINSVSYGQYSLDLQKAFTTPGTEAKELFRPRGGLTVQAQPANDLSVAAQWFYNWQAVRLPESGSYLTINDGLNFGADSAIVAANPFFGKVPGTPAFLRAWNVSTIAPSRNNLSLGDWGLSSRWSPDWLNGTIGLYYRKTNDIFPQLLLTPGLAPNVRAAVCRAIGGQPLPGGNCIINKHATSLADLQKFGKFGTYQTAYGDNIQILGASIAKEIAGVSVAAELSYRKKMPLQSTFVNVVPAALVAKTPGSIATNAIPNNGTPGALGDTYHGLINALYVAPKTFLFDTASLSGEVTWNQWATVTQNEAVFKGNSSYTGIDKVSRSAYTAAVNFTPTWFQVFPGVDMLAPVTFSDGISGNSAVLFGGNKDAGTWSAGAGADIYQKYRVQLSYNGYFGNYSTTPSGAMNLPNGSSAALSDRGWVSLTFKATF